MDQSFEQLVKNEQLLESLIIMLGRSNKKLDDLSKRISQIEQYILEVAPSETPFPDASYSFISKVEKQTRNTPNA